MDWFEIADMTGLKHLINASAIMYVTYYKDTNLTEIIFTRSGYQPMYMKGELVNDIKRLLNSHNHYVSKIGE